MKQHTATHEFDQYARNYLEALDHPLRRVVDPSGSNYFIELKCQEIGRVIAEANLVPSDLTVLDLGSGIGLFENRLHGTFKNLLALDLSLESLKVAHNLYPLHPSGQYVGGDALRLPIASNSVDMAFTSCMFHHMPHSLLAPTIAEMRRVCRDGGHVLIFEHNPLNPITQLVVKTTPIDKNAQLLLRRAIVNAMQNAGLDITAQRFILYGPKMLDRLLRQLLNPALYRVPLGGQYYVVGRK